MFVLVGGGVSGGGDGGIVVICAAHIGLMLSDCLRCEFVYSYKLMSSIYFASVVTVVPNSVVGMRSSMITKW